MADKSNIEWTDATWNPIRGCSRVSEGYRNCYAEKVAARFSGPGQAYEGLANLITIGLGTPKERREAQWTGKMRFVDSHLRDPLRWRRPRKIFVNSMSDLFHEGVHDAELLRVWMVMAEAKHHTFQILTKRPKRMLEWCKRLFGENPLRDVLPNVWLGVSVEDQKTADERIPLLIQTPAAVRFISAEPLLGPIDLHNIPFTLDWIIVGGESGPGARPMHPEWVRQLRDQCDDDGVAFFFKQWGAWQNGSNNLPSKNRENLIVLRDGKVLSWAEGTKESNRYKGDGACAMSRVGKKAAGALLDGKLHREFPVTSSSGSSGDRPSSPTLTTSGGVSSP